MKQKTFEFPDSLASDFEAFCKSRMLVEKRIAAVAIFHLLNNVGADEREAVLMAYQEAHGHEYDEQAKARKAEHRQPRGKGKRGPQ